MDGEEVLVVVEDDPVEGEVELELLGVVDGEVVLRYLVLEDTLADLGGQDNESVLVVEQ